MVDWWVMALMLLAPGVGAVALAPPSGGAGGTLAPAFYMAVGGNDGNAGTLASPLATIHACKVAMEGDPTKKTCYIRAGSYTPVAADATICNGGTTCAVGLSSASDNGLTFSNYPPDGVDSADFTGGSTSDSTGLWDIFYVGNTTSVTITGLNLHHFRYSAISSQGGNHSLVVTNNILSNGFCVVNSGNCAGTQGEAAIQCFGCTSATIKNNAIHDMASFGTSFTNANGNLNNLDIENNVVYHTCTGLQDCGGIYWEDVLQTSTNIQVKNNYVLDGAVFDTAIAGWGAGLYMDDCTSNSTVTGNIVTGANGGNNIMIHGGSNNAVTGNLVDLATLGMPILREQASSCSAVTGNTFQNNVILSAAAGGGYTGVSGTVTVAHNAYHNYGPGTLSTSGDASPVSEDPLITCNTYRVTGGSPVFNSPVSFPALPISWGPPGFLIPAGTALSTSVGCAATANTFLSSMGVNIHRSQGFAEAAYEPEFTFTGIRNARDFYVATDFVTMHNNTVSGTYPGVKFDILADAPSTIVAEGNALVAANAFLAAEGPNEPNNFTITYLGNPGGGSGTWVPVAQFQRDLYLAINGSALAAYPVFNVSETGAEHDNVGLQCLSLNAACPGAASVTLMAANIFYADYANVHNYVQGNGSCGTFSTRSVNQAWQAMDPTLNSCWDGFYGDQVVTWSQHFAGYNVGQAPTTPRITSETGWDSATTGSTLDYQGKIDLLTYLDGFKRGNAYTFIYEMVDAQGSTGNQGLYDNTNTAKLAATYVHNLTTVLADTTVFAPRQLNYTIPAEPASVHDLLLQKANGEFYLLIWDEQTTSGTTDNITVTFPVATTATEYDTVVGTSPVNTFTSTTSIPLTLSDHAVILAIP